DAQSSAQKLCTALDHRQAREDRRDDLPAAVRVLFQKVLVRRRLRFDSLVERLHQLFRRLRVRLDFGQRQDVRSLAVIERRQYLGQVLHLCSKTPGVSANQRSNVLSGSLFQPLTRLSKKFSVFQKQNRYSPGLPPDSTGGDLTRLVHAKNSA